MRVIFDCLYICIKKVFETKINICMQIIATFILGLAYFVMLQALQM